MSQVESFVAAIRAAMPLLAELAAWIAGGSKPTCLEGLPSVMRSRIALNAKEERNRAAQR
jgi:hypothetical protein